MNAKYNANLADRQFKAAFDSYLEVINNRALLRAAYAELEAAENTGASLRRAAEGLGRIGWDIIAEISSDAERVQSSLDFCDKLIGTLKDALDSWTAGDRGDFAAIAVKLSAQRLSLAREAAKAAEESCRMLEDLLK